MPNILIPAVLLFSFTLIIFHSAALDIGLGGGGYPSPPSQSPENCAPPPPPPPAQICPTSSPPPPGINARLQRDLKVIQRFKSLIQKDIIRNDPNNITKTWKGNNPCDFKGFLCSHNPKYLEETLSDVQFNGFNLGGVQLSGFIDQLLDISIFHANSNSFSGCFPAATLPFLFELDLSNNKLEGPIPASFACLKSMQILNFRNNQLDGVVPEAVSLQNLTLSFNYFTEVGPRCRALIDKKVLDVSMNCISSGLGGQRDPHVCNKFFQTHPYGKCSSANLNNAPCKIYERRRTAEPRF